MIENLVRLLQWWNGGFYLYAGIFVGYQTNNLIMILVFEATTAFWSNQTLEMISQDMSIRKCFTNDVAWIHVLGWPSLALVLKEIDHFLEIQHYRHYHDQNHQQQHDDEEENKEQPKECTEQRFQYHKLHCGSMDDRKANDESTPILG